MTTRLAPTDSSMLKTRPNFDRTPARGSPLGRRVSALAGALTGALSPALFSALFPLIVASITLPLALPGWAQTSQTTPQDSSSGNATGGPIRLRQTDPGTRTPPGTSPSGERTERPDRLDRPDRLERRDRRDPLDPRFQPYLPSDFELFVRKIAGQEADAENGIRRFGADLMAAPPRGEAGEPVPVAPADYVVGVGDELLLTIWGSVDADLRLKVDRGGRISIPRVGPVPVAGVKYSDLQATITPRVAQVFRNFQLSVSLAQLRDIRVYVTGFTPRPGAYTVSSLSTIVNALMQAGGPAASGSFRKIELRRAGKLVSTFDLYELLLKGDKTADRVLASDDVVHIGAVGPQVALIGSVNKPAVFEIKTGESVADVLLMAGGFTAVADRARLAIERLGERGGVRIKELVLPQDLAQTPGDGDVMRAFSAVDTALPILPQNKRVRVEGEVVRPGEIILPSGSSVADAIRAAGGLTAAAYVFGTEFNRESVRITQQENYERALRDLETEMTRASSTQRAISADEAAAQAARSTAGGRLIERLRAVKPTGRIVLQATPGTSQLPELALEDGDRLYIPARPTTVGVFGSVFNSGSYLHASGRGVEDYLRLAGGPTRGADTGSLFVVRANGSVVSGRQNSGFFSLGSGLSGVAAEPGDTIFVPEELNKTTFIQEAKEWTQILYQFGLGAAALRTLKN